MGYLGLEPRTIRLKAEYSTIELVTLNYILTRKLQNMKVFIIKNHYSKIIFYFIDFKVKY